MYRVGNDRDFSEFFTEQILHDVTVHDWHFQIEKGNVDLLKRGQHLIQHGRVGKLDAADALPSKHLDHYPQVLHVVVNDECASLGHTLPPESVRLRSYQTSRPSI